MKNLVDMWLRQAVARLPESMVPPSGREAYVEVRRPKDACHGDLASNVALRLASAARREAWPLAEAIKSALPADPAVAKVEIAGAGFLNFFLSESYHHGEVRRALREGGDYGKSTLQQGHALKIEVASVDSQGPLHAGHARRAAYGASVAALLEATGCRVRRECRIVAASPCSSTRRGPGTQGSQCRGPDLASVRRELGEFGVRFDSWAPAEAESLSASVEHSKFPAAPTLLRRRRKGPAMPVSGEGVALSALRAEIGNDAVRLFCVLRASDEPLFLDLDLAAARSLDNPLYAVQYAHARIASLRREVEARGLPFHRAADFLGLLAEPRERTLVRRVSAYRDIIEQSANERAPHLLARHLCALADDFHAYHGEHPLVVADPTLREARLGLASAAQVVIRNGLRLLGVAAPDTV